MKNYNPQSQAINNLEELKMLGFEVEPFGSNTFKINTVPLTLKNINYQNRWFL